MRRQDIKGGILILTLLFGVGCHHEEVSPRVRQLQSSLQQMEQENAKYDDKIRDARSDPGLRQQLSADRELLKSRIERVQEQLKSETPQSH